MHGSVGAGHKRAAQALSETFQMDHPEIVVEVVDIGEAGDSRNDELKRHVCLGHSDVL